MNRSAFTPFAPTTISIPAHQLLCIREFAARKDVRYYLNTLHICTKDGRAYISATDGHMGAIIRTEEASVDGPDISWLIPIEVFDKLSKSPVSITFSPPMALGAVLTDVPEIDKKQTGDSSIDFSSSWRCEVQLQQDAQTRSIASLEAGTRFPDLGKLFPKETGGCAAPIDSALLVRIYKAYAALKNGNGLGGKRSTSKLGNGASAHPVFGYPVQADTVLLLDFRDANFTGLVMPLRGQGKAATADWLWDYGNAQDLRPLNKLHQIQQKALEAKTQQRKVEQKVRTPSKRAQAQPFQPLAVRTSPSLRTS